MDGACSMKDRKRGMHLTFPLKKLIQINHLDELDIKENIT
jgi:hypothetical protein